MQQQESSQPDENETKNEEQPQSLFGIIVHSFFIIPFLIVVFCLVLFTAITLLTREQQTAFDFIEDIKTGGLTKRWQGAFELSKLLAQPELIPDDKRFTAELINAFYKSKHDDNRVRQYLALAMGRTANPDFFEPLVKDFKNEKEENLYALIYALGLLQDKRATEILSGYLDHPQARIRSASVVALGNIADPRAVDQLKTALNDSEPNVQWGAALSLAKLHNSTGKDILANLLDVEYLKQFKKIDPEEQTHLMLMAVEAADLLNEPCLMKQVKILSTKAKNMKVRAAAFKALKNE